MSDQENANLVKSSIQAPMDSDRHGKEEQIPKKVTESADSSPADVKEIGGPKGLEPTRYGDWEAKGRCYDF